MITTKAVTERIHALLAEKNMTVYRLAKNANMYPCDLYNALSGERPFYPSWRKRIAQALGVPEEELFEEGSDHDDE